MGWTEGKTKKQIKAVIDKRNATRLANAKAGTTNALKAKAKRVTKKAKKELHTLREREARQTVPVNIHVTVEDKTTYVAKSYVVGVRYLEGYSSQAYSYLSDIADIEQGDIVVVDAAGVLKVAKVVSIGGNGYHGQMKWVISKVDMTAHRERSEARKRKQELGKKLLELKKKMDNATMYEKYAEESPEFAAVLEEWKSINV